MTDLDTRYQRSVSTGRRGCRPPLINRSTAILSAVQDSWMVSEVKIHLHSCCYSTPLGSSATETKYFEKSALAVIDSRDDEAVDPTHICVVSYA